MCADQELIAHDALSALINLTSSISIAARLAKIDGFITGLVRMIIVSSLVALPGFLGDGPPSRIIFGAC